MESCRGRHFALALGLQLLVGAVVDAQHQDRGAHVATFGVTAELVAIPVSVTDRSGHTVVDLRLENFLITQDGAAQQIQSVSRWNVPASIGVVFDASGSMKRTIRTAQAAVRALLDGSSPEDEAFLIRFADRPELVVDFTHDSGVIADKLLWDRPRGATALNDAVVLALTKVKAAKSSRQALVVITDGGDNNSRYSFPELVSIARESYAQVYIVAMRRNLLDKEEQRGRLRLEQLANDTGGRLITVDRTSELPHALAKVNELIRNQYLLTFRPPAPLQDGKWHAVRVRLQPGSKASAYRVSARGGFYAPKP